MVDDTQRLTSSIDLDRAHDDLDLHKSGIVLLELRVVNQHVVETCSPKEMQQHTNPGNVS